MKVLRTNDIKEFSELLKKIQVDNIVSMEVETYKGSYLEGINWDYLKYVYNKEKDSSHSSYADYTIVYKDAVSSDRLLSDFEDLQSSGCSLSSEVIIRYE